LNLEVSTLLNPRTVQDDKQLARSIGVLLRSLRKRRGLSQSLLATRAAGKLLPVAKALGLTAVILRYETTSSLAPNQSNDRC
jgi:transcriptional regulator with XRE-family HTH domain